MPNDLIKPLKPSNKPFKILKLDPKTEYDLIITARNGDSYAFEQLYNNYSKIINSYIYSLSVPVSERDDLVQEGIIGLLKAVRTYDNVSSSFATYASLCIKRSIISALRKYNRSSRVVLSDDPASISETTDFVPSPEMNMVDIENTKQRYDTFISKLSKFEKQTFNLYIKGKTYIKIAEELACTEKSIDNAVTRIKSKLRNLK